MTLLPCPLCYQDASFQTDDEDDPFTVAVSIVCSGCDLTLPAGEVEEYGDTKTEMEMVKASAAARWNTRPETA